MENKQITGPGDTTKQFKNLLVYTPLLLIFGVFYNYGQSYQFGLSYFSSFGYADSFIQIFAILKTIILAISLLFLTLLVIIILFFPVIICILLIGSILDRLNGRKQLRKIMKIKLDLKKSEAVLLTNLNHLVKLDEPDNSTLFKEHYETLQNQFIAIEQYKSTLKKSEGFYSDSGKWQLKSIFNLRDNMRSDNGVDIIDLFNKHKLKIELSFYYISLVTVVVFFTLKYLFENMIFWSSIWLFIAILLSIVVTHLLIFFKVKKDNSQKYVLLNLIFYISFFCIFFGLLGNDHTKERILHGDEFILTLDNEETYRGKVLSSNQKYILLFTQSEKILIERDKISTQHKNNKKPH